MSSPYPSYATAVCAVFLQKGSALDTCGDPTSLLSGWLRNMSRRPGEHSFNLVAFLSSGLSPVSTSSLAKCCVYPLMLYGVENWILCTTSLLNLEEFQGEMTKRILKLPNWFSNNAAKIMALNAFHLHHQEAKVATFLRIMAMEDRVFHCAFCSLVAK